MNTTVLYWNALQNFCVLNGHTPAPKVKRIKGKTGRIRFLSDEEIQALLNELQPTNPLNTRPRFAQEMYDFVVALLHTGARSREIATLKLSQIDLEKNTITIHRSKGGTDTTLQMSKLLRGIVDRRLAESLLPNPNKTLHCRTGNGFLFPSIAAAKQYESMVWDKAIQRLNLKDVTLHTLRHTAAVKWLKGSLSIVDVQHLLGHRNLASTMCYMHLVPNQAANRAAEIFNA